jgi:hypothetical protein
MPEYWFVVKPQHDALYEALRRVVAVRPGYHVIIERRSPEGPRVPTERRTSKVWEGDEILIAERPGAERA